MNALKIPNPFSRTPDPGVPPKGLLYRYHDSMCVGGVHRFIITYIPKDSFELGSSLWVSIKNVETIFMRPNLLSGPYVFYCDVVPAEYDNRKRCFITADQPHYQPYISPGQSIKVELSMHNLRDKYVWVVTVSSQIVFNSSSTINFEIAVCREESQLHKRYWGDHFGSFCQTLDVQHLNTLDLWNRPPKFTPSKEHPVHLVILTHGMYSNVTADMLYMADRIYQAAAKTGDNLVIRGYTGNLCQTERGVKYLGRRLAEWIITECVPEIGEVDKISFIAHSLGGLSQTFAVAYIQHNYPEFFKLHRPENFITMASPLLGITGENPAYVKLFLTFGIVGKTGQDLGLQGSKPLLLLLPSSSTRKALRMFKRRTVYANVLHDGIVPLRTASLLYIDYNALTGVYDTLKSQGLLNPHFKKPLQLKQPSSQVGEVPESVEKHEDLSGEPDDSSVRSSQSTSSTQSTYSSYDSELGGSDEISISSSRRPRRHKLHKWKPNLRGPINEHKLKKYKRYQTKADGTGDGTSVVRPDGPPEMPIPKTSVVTSMMRVIAPDSPPERFIMDPSSRSNVILHDKIYRPSMIPHNPRERTSSILKLDVNERKHALEESIARKWHRGLTWRKVLVNLPPDAHNNMIVRRMFANAGGWGAVDHMVENHFGESCVKGEDLEQWELNEEDKTVEIFSDEDESNEDKAMKEIEEHMAKLMLHEKAKSKDEAEATGTTRPPARSSTDPDIDIPQPRSARRKADEDEGWINDNDSIVYDGPTGMLNTLPQSVNGGMEAISNALFPEESNRESNSITLEERQAENDQIEVQASEMMNSYI